MSNFDMRYCRKCERVTMHVGPSTSHLLHLVLTVFTVGVWLPVWIFIAVRNEFSYDCTSCDGRLMHEAINQWTDERPLLYRAGRSVGSALNRFKKWRPY